MPSCHVALRNLGRLWESVQVELHGQYSVQRMIALRRHEETTTWARAVGVASLTPLPCILLIIGIDSMTLSPPEDGFDKQNFALWIRMFAFGFVTAFSICIQFVQAVPDLPLSTRRLWVISILVGVALFPVSYAFIVTIGFPVPFAIQLETTPFMVIFGTALWLSWRHTLRVNNEAKTHLMRWFLVLQPQIVIIFAYTAYNLVFNLLNSSSQIFFTALLPLIKLCFKIWVGHRVFHLEDMTPVIVVFSVDVFHTLFVSVTMQQAQTVGSTVVIMVIDVVQGMIAYYEIHIVLRRVRQLSKLIKQLNKATMANPASGPRRRSTATVDLSLGGVNYAIQILQLSEQMREHPEIALPRHRRASSVFGRSSVGPTARFTAVSPLNHSDLLQKDPSARSQLEEAQVQCIQSVLQLLHMTEFYMLVEFAEVMMAGIYASYLFALSVLPNRVYYTQLSQLTDTEIGHAARHVAGYATLELLSFVIFSVAVDRKMIHFSALRQLGFALETHWRLVQSIFIMWTFATLQVTLKHFGTDYTFRFQWLRNHTSQ